MKEETKAVYLATGKHWKFEDLIKANVDVDFVVRLSERMTVILFQIRHLTFQSYNPTVNSGWIPGN